MKAHGDQMYGGNPYVTHLDAVVQVLKDAGFMDPTFLMAGYLHDSLEDTATTALDLKAEGFSPEVVKAVQFCTDEPGHNRKTRKAATYARVKVNPHIVGLAVKWADRIANIESCKAEGNTGLLQMYRKEDAAFRDAYTPPKTLLAGDKRYYTLLVRYERSQ